MTSFQHPFNPEVKAPATAQRVRLITLTLLLIALAVLVLLNGHSAYLEQLNVNTYIVFAKLQQPAVTPTIQYFTLLGNKYLLGLFILLVFVWLVRRRYFYDAIHLAAVTFLSMAVVWLMKHSLQIPRPDNLLLAYDNWSFPSGHTTLSAAIYGFLTILLLNSTQQRPLRRLIAATMVTLVALIAISRLYLGVHWFTDIIGGLLVGSFVCTAVSYNYFRSPPLTQPATTSMLLALFNRLLLVWLLFAAKLYFF